MTSHQQTYIEWKRQNAAVGCLFARLLSNRTEVDGYRLVEVTRKTTKPLAAKIDELVNSAIGEPDIHALTILLSELTSLDQWLDVAKLLSEMPGWILQNSLISHDGDDQIVALQLTHELLRDDGKVVPSEVLFLGPFPEFPNTRQSPVAALEMYVGTPRAHDAVTNKPIEQANLAHIDARLPTPTAFKKMVENTAIARRKSLGLSDGEDDMRAKAKVSFVVPLDMFEKKETK